MTCLLVKLSDSFSLVQHTYVKEELSRENLINSTPGGYLDTTVCAWGPFAENIILLLAQKYDIR